MPTAFIQLFVTFSSIIRGDKAFKGEGCVCVGIVYFNSTSQFISVNVKIFLKMRMNDLLTPPPVSAPGPNQIEKACMLFCGQPLHHHHRSSLYPINLGRQCPKKIQISNFGKINQVKFSAWVILTYRMMRGSERQCPVKDKVSQLKIT